MGPLIARSLAFLLILSLLSVVVPSRATAASAADTATARDLATQALQHYREQNYERSLDLMKRAQALFDAPVHLLYIARSERELGRLVEAAEVFRSLGKRSLAEGAPQQFRDAVDEARRELAELEPQIPRLVIQLQPTDANVTSLKIDGKAVPTAVLGIERVVNPGPHRVQVRAERYAPAEQAIEVPRGEVANMTLRLEPSEPAPLAKAGVDQSDRSKLAEQSQPAAADSIDRYELVFGLRLGAAVPGGEVPANLVRPGAASGTAPMDDLAGGGGELELRAGFKGPLRLGFLRRWSVHLFGSGGQLGQKTLAPMGSPALMSLQDQDVDVMLQPSFASFGLTLGVAQARGEFGGFFELSAMAQRLMFDYETSSGIGLCGGDKATGRRTGNGGGLRLGGGVGIPIGSWGLVSPFVTLSAATVDSIKSETNGCFDQLVQLVESEEPVENSATYTFFGLGVGGELFVGL